MKKILFTTLVIILPLIATGCLNEVKEGAESLKEDTVKAYDNLKEEINELSDKFTETKNKVEETAQDIDNAKESIGEVFD